ncbi:MAG: GTPase HflX [Candidatus Scalindua sp. AMX11]|nr:MAG: GTPase HflX [Candidatus Scalindua sp.]NOG83274.1 GTPase HflX [Planctomycetota bacterium]RZV71964.1 MAG: GTPase HflX [Candidatus Scalindua sp. SCAELEC01]TDE63332.1 MAG: GTPase HflX [Candidatus Scalindua sp. AMX11]GJQ60044.1 MAG: GTPase HflX [Candidatus Scalindua sp.]
MADPKRTGLSVRSERAILLHTILNKGNGYETHLAELANLATTAGANVLDTLTQKRFQIDPYYYVGKGKAKQLALLCKDKSADVVICDDDLAPAQVRNLEEIIDTKVIDRSELILDIFATRAKTTQAKLQVELAQLEYTKPRLKRMWTHLSRIEGGIGTRGPGEKQLEVDRRIISKKIMTLKTKLRQIEQRRASQVKSRKELTKVSLVGYTNAGKSTLMNKLTDAEVFVEDKPFATLDTKTSLCHLGDGNKVVLSDTVGFIRKLPHHLISSFLATLEEVRWADLLLHVVDVSAPDTLEQVNAVYQVLKELGCDNKPMITLLNKVDAVTDRSIITFFQSKHDNTVSISALSGLGLEKLKKEIVHFANRNRKEIKLICNSSNGKLWAYVHQNSKVLNQTFEDSYVHFHILIEEKYLSRLYELRENGDTIHYL